MTGVEGAHLLGCRKFTYNYCTTTVDMHIVQCVELRINTYSHHKYFQSAITKAGEF